MKHRKFDFRTAYIDLLLNVLTGLVFIFAIATLLINTPKKTEEEGMKKKAEWVATVSWPADMDCDIDTWVRGPDGTLVYFQQKDGALMHIERDDLGFHNDMFSVMSSILKGQQIEPDNQNEEIWVLRGLVPGEFFFNVHLFSCRRDATPLKLGTMVRVPVEVVFTKVNPNYENVMRVKTEVLRVWDEATVLNFTLDAEGNMTSYNRNTHKLVVVKPGKEQ